MSKFKLSTRLFANNEEISLFVAAGAPEKHVGVMAPMGIGLCHSLRGKLNTPAKYSSAAKLLDLMFVSKSCACISSENNIYGEVSDGTNYVRFVCDGKTITYEKERLHGALAVVPMVLFALRNEGIIPELGNAFNDVRNVVAAGSDKKELMRSIALFCDTYYYGVAKSVLDDVLVKENALNLADVQKAADDGEYSPMKVFTDMVQPKLTGIQTGKGKKVVTRPANDDFFARIKAGEYDIAAEWNEKQKIRIPDKQSLDAFVPSETYFSMVSKIKTRLDKVLLRMDAGMTGPDAIGRDHIDVFITGKPGTGKTTLAYALGAATNMPVYTVAMTKNTEEDVFQGMNKVVDGALKFVSTDFLDAYTNGGIIILEEINLPDPSVVMGALGQAVEFPFILMKDGYIPVKRHPLCVIIGTMNIGTFGSKGVNQALSSRFRQSYILNDPTREDFLKILCNTGAKKREASWVLKAYEKITDYLKSPSVNAEDVCLNVTLRGCIGALENMSEGESGKEAIRNTLVGKISEVDLALAEDVYKNVVQSLPEI